MDRSEQRQRRGTPPGRGAPGGSRMWNEASGEGNAAARGRGRGRGRLPIAGRARRRPQQNDGYDNQGNTVDPNDFIQRQSHDGRIGYRPRAQQYDGQANDNGHRQQNNRRDGRAGNRNRRDNSENEDHNNDNNQGYERNNRSMGYKALQDIADAEGPDVLVKLRERSKLFGNLINSNIDKHDLIVLLMKVVSKVCASSFEQLKLDMLMELCDSKFIGTLRNYLMDLPYVLANEKRKNNMYWGNPTGFWSDLISFFECIILRSPSTAMQKCRSLIDGATKACLEGLKERHFFKLPTEDELKLTELRDRLLICEKEEEKKVERPRFEADEASEPPENFRQLSVLPTHDDLINDRPFLRPNIVHGKYVSVEHYLDVQFRLLREDCIGPLRAGILQYIKDPQKKKFDNIRIYSGVKLVEPYVSQEKVGILVQFDAKTSNRHKKINWDHSKRLLYGSLVLFSRNNFQDMLVATVLDRDKKVVAKGKIAVAFKNMAEVTQSPYTDYTYVMAESEVYYEPYYHVLRALQDPGFPNQIAMSKYIIQVDPVPQNPQYLTQDGGNSTYTMELIPGYASKEVQVLDDQTWPSSYELGLNTSQYEAYKLALTHEFAVIQGPPGTGKTFLGVKVAKALLENVPKIRLLLICFTNHALDQFLEAILNITDSIVRIGGQSRSENLLKYNLMKLRSQKRDNHGHKLFYEQRYLLKHAVSDMQSLQKKINNINNGVLPFDLVKRGAPEMQCLEEFYSEKNGDPLMQWLFDNLEYNAEILGEYDYEDAVFDANAMDDDDNPNRMGVLLDDFDEQSEFDEDETFGGHEILKIQTKFNVAEAEADIKQLKILASRVDNENKFETLQMQIIVLMAKIKRFNEMSVLRKHDINKKITDRQHPRLFPIADRWAIYFSLAKKYTNLFMVEMMKLQHEHESANTAYEEARMVMDLKILNEAKVIGMTTSGAARLRKLLQTLAPKIVIVEEAAEVLECHIVTALTSRCQHLILIGDHQQLRPSTASYRLAREFNMEISLFERMINNGVHSRRLGVQHRMRPEIAALITPSIYSDLANHESVEAFPQVRGLENNLHFLTHDFKEKSVEDSSSRCNEQEADLVLGFANYLMQQGYDPEHVTVLAAYSGQMFYMRKQRPLYNFLAKVKITVVDNYQGEESKIILLSLVRNNSENKIGFLGTINRVCVALSRAREGFYMFGNIDILRRNADIWEKIAVTLEQNGSLAPNIRLQCENHPEQITIVESATDFQKTPEGGCMLKCSHNLRCGHLCPLICHGYDRGHTTIICPLKCDRVLCELGHVCPLKCAEQCAPCMILIEKSLPCKHSMLVHCHLDPEDKTIQCKTIVDVTLPDCGHQAKKPCYLEQRLVACHVPCVFRVDTCGHQCRRKCHAKDDPDHRMYNCEKPCAKAKAGCKADLVGDRGDHQCQKRCHETCDDCNVEVIKKRSTCKHSDRVACRFDVDEKPCTKNCARTIPACGHFCKNKCFEPCGDCKQRVTKTIPACGHEVTVACKTEPTRDLCTSACERILPCGHACRGRCAQPCLPDRCTALVDQQLPSPCGHAVRLPCNVYRSYVDGVKYGKVLLEHCTAPCSKMLSCEHACAGSCGACRQGRLHVPCAKQCSKINICGHQCLEPCNQLCPPCKRPCDVKCPHSKCNKICGNPCAPCKEACERKCPHGRCSRRCGEPCDRPPCPRPCPAPLSCGHPCRGLCGEPCPDICKLCRPEDFPKDFIGWDYDDDDKFVKLQDCPHVLDLDNMDSLMTADSETVTIRGCPFCRQPIINTYRYKDRINEMFKKEINPIKEKIYGSKRQIEAKQQELLRKASTFLEVHLIVYQGNSHWRAAFDKMNDIVLRKLRVTDKRTRAPPKESLLQLQMYTLYLDILEMVASSYKQYREATVKKDALADEVSGQVALVCSTLANNMRKISQQQQNDIGNEIKRLHAIIQLAKVKCNDVYASCRTVPEVVSAMKAAENKICTWGVYDQATATTALKKLESAMKISGVVSKQERDLVVQAIGLTSGHWFKCPNGHFYCIGECGGAMQVSRCVECGARIGGSSHRLLADNQHAPEMDGSQYPAWSELANNMANFRLD